MHDTINVQKEGEPFEDIVRHCELLQGVSLDSKEVRKSSVRYLEQGLDKSIVEITQELDKEERLGAMLAKLVSVSEEIGMHVDILTIYGTVLFGKHLIAALGSPWMVKPTLEKVFELTGDKLEKAKNIKDSYHASHEYYMVNQKTNSLISDIGHKWEQESTNPENIRYGLEKYMQCASILERMFPFLLAIKRIIDNKSPSLANLRNLKSYKVRNELTNRTDSPNSVYFDCIVKQYDRRLRNGIAHGDTLINPTESVVELPNENKEYDFSEINNILKKNFTSMVFLSGVCIACIDLRYIYNDTNLEARELFADM